MSQLSPSADAAERRVFLIDGSSFVYRSYFQSLNQDPKYNARPSDGLPTGAVRLFVTKMMQIAREGAAGSMPTHVVVAFDAAGARSGRTDIHPGYKASRRKTPDDLRPQMPLMRRAVEAVGFTPIECQGYEADDLIASYARAAADAGAAVVVISADKDLMQIVGPGVRFFDFASGKPGKPGYRPERDLDEAGVADIWEGLTPGEIADAMALVGDPVDDVPGVPGIGLKTAAQMLREFGGLEALLAGAERIRQPKRREAILSYADQIRMSRRLTHLDDATPLPVPLDRAVARPLDPVVLLAFLKALELDAAANRVAKAYALDPDDVEPDPALRADTTLTPVADEAESALRAFENVAYALATRLQDLRALADEARHTGTLAMEVHTAEGAIVGIALSPAPGRAVYVPTGHGNYESLFAAAPKQIPLDDVIAELAPLLADRAVVKIGHDVKTNWAPLDRRLAAVLEPFEDVMLASYALDSGRQGHGLEALSVAHLRRRGPDIADVVGSGRARIGFAAAASDHALAYCAERADVIGRLWRILSSRLDGALERVYRDLELHMVPILSEMERQGIAVDRAVLSRLSGEMGETMRRLEGQIGALAGGPVHLASPKQVGDLLFGRLDLPGGKRTATGQWMTRANLLEDLAGEGHELPVLILEWRQMAKLKSTYADALIHHADASGRVHTTFALAATSTGRLASADPNLQNIPIRTPEGRKIRAAFVASQGHVLVSADYSQIELRLLAHMARIPEMRAAFERGDDIHALTASEMFKVPVEGMDPAVRRRAKAINFGIVYGISGFGLARQLSIPRREAEDYIARYFERFPGILAYMEATKNFCRAHGYVETLFGRRCHFPTIATGNAADRAAVERAAINAPIQGTAADVIRRAMIRMPDALREAGLSARMLLQVHDELVFEARREEMAETIRVARTVMEEAPGPDISLNVPLVVDARAAPDWGSAH